MTVRTVIVDDEPPARRHLIRLLDDVERIEIVGEAETGPNAVEVIRTQRPNLVLLDIEMPGMNGLEVVEAIGPDRMPNTIFVTAYDEYAVKAFEVRALDYLMKPVTKDRLGKALDRLFALADSEADRARKLLTILDHIRPPPRYLERLVCTKGDRAFLVPVADITHIVAAGNYVEAFTATGSHLNPRNPAAHRNRSRSRPFRTYPSQHDRLSRCRHRDSWACPWRRYGAPGNPSAP